MAFTEKGSQTKYFKKWLFLCKMLFESFFGPITPLKLTYAFKTGISQISQIHQNWTLSLDTENDKNEQFPLIDS